MKLLKFFGTWCGPCKVLSSQLEGFQMDGITEIKNVDVDKEQDFSDAFNLKGIPTLILVDEENNELWRTKGLITQDVLKDELKPFLKKEDLVTI